MKLRLASVLWAELQRFVRFEMEVARGRPGHSVVDRFVRRNLVADWLAPRVSYSHVFVLQELMYRYV